MDREDEILKEIGALLEQGDRAEAERLVLREWADKMDLALEETRQAWKEWKAEAVRETE